MIALELPNEIADDDRQAVFDWLRDYNQTANPVWWAKMDEIGEATPLTVLARDNRAVVGGLLAETCLSWLKVQLMVVQPVRRRGGVGRAMLHLAETEARRRGCRYSFLDTMQYQAPEFYRACDYEQVGRIDDWDSHGHAKFLFSKRLAV